MNPQAHQFDILIVGAGVTGLWLLDELVNAGYQALLIESTAIGQGQTVCAQGIIHGGLKYTLKGIMTGAADAIRDMPDIWRDCANHKRKPDLSKMRIRSEFCYLWRTNKISSKLGMAGAKVGLRVTPTVIDKKNIPPILNQCPGQIFKLDEQVIDPVSMLKTLADQHPTRILKTNLDNAQWNLSQGRLEQLTTAEGLTLKPDNLILTAGLGNASLRQLAGIKEQNMQIRPLHMVMVKGDLPHINGHCIDGGATRMTITSDLDNSGTVVWQLGGQIAENGVNMDRDTLITAAVEELKQVIPGIDLTGLQWGTYRIDRAEAQTSGNNRPDNVQIFDNHNIFTVWPTKMALAPRVAQQMLTRLNPPANHPTPQLDTAPVQVAPPPWEWEDVWKND